MTDRSLHEEKTASSAVPPDATVLVTGGAGFIGSNFIRFLLNREDFAGRVVNLDKLTYAGNLMNLDDVVREHGGSRYVFERGDICEFGALQRLFERYAVSHVVHFAAESHVDRSIFGPGDFIETNISGTFALLEAARKAWNGRQDARFHHISTDEVYGSLGDTGLFTESTAYDPRSPYSASKASSDHLVRAFHHTYGLPVTISNCSNNYGPFQFPEKLIPLAILNAAEGRSIPVYGDGRNVRDWLHVEDHAEAVWLIMRRGVIGETYNIGGETEKENIEVVRQICETLETLRPSRDNPALRTPDSALRTYKDLITYVPDRPGHDRRYAIDCAKIKRDLEWKARYDFDMGLRKTIEWYMNNPEWVRSVRNGDYRMWIDRNYGNRESAKGVS